MRDIRQKRQESGETGVKRDGSQERWESGYSGVSRNRRYERQESGGMGVRRFRCEPGGKRTGDKKHQGWEAVGRKQKAGKRTEWCRREKVIKAGNRIHRGKEQEMEGRKTGGRL